jgi:hypothetical protein
MKNNLLVITRTTPGGGLFYLPSVTILNTVRHARNAVDKNTVPDILLMRPIHGK